MSSDANNEQKPVKAPTILVVEDDLMTRKAVARKLQAGGYEVIAVPSAADALIVAQRLAFQVLVLDLHLVADDPFAGIHEGFAVLDWLRRQLGDLEFRIVIHTSQSGPSMIKKAEENGAFAFCTKQRDLSNLLECVNEAVQSLKAA